MDKVNFEIDSEQNFNNDNNDHVKNYLVIKKSERKLEKRFRCNNFIEVATMMIRRHWDISDLYVTHFLTLDNTTVTQFLVLRKCDIVLDQLIKRVHSVDQVNNKNHFSNESEELNFTTKNVFPVSILIQIIKMFCIGSYGHLDHNDIKPSNIGFLVIENAENEIKCEFIDFGSVNYTNTIEEKESTSRFPSTYVYLPQNRLPIKNLEGVNFSELEEKMLENIADSVTLNKTTNGGGALACFKGPRVD